MVGDPWGQVVPVTTEAAQRRLLEVLGGVGQQSPTALEALAAQVDQGRLQIDLGLRKAAIWKSDEDFRTVLNASLLLEELVHLIRAVATDTNGVIHG
jgi:hypothetical protein